MFEIVTIDTGTTSIRGILFDQYGKQMHVCQFEKPPIYHKNGWVEQDPQTWLTKLFEILKDLKAKADSAGTDISAVSLTSQRSSVIPVDNSGKAYIPRNHVAGEENRVLL